jgi:hypothetical protein
MSYFDPNYYQGLLSETRNISCILLAREIFIIRTLEIHHLLILDFNDPGG